MPVSLLHNNYCEFPTCTHKFIWVIVYIVQRNGLKRGFNGFLMYKKIIISEKDKKLI